MCIDGVTVYAATSGNYIIFKLYKEIQVFFIAYPKKINFFVLLISLYFVLPELYI